MCRCRRRAAPPQDKRPLLINRRWRVGDATTNQSSFGRRMLRYVAAAVIALVSLAADSRAQVKVLLVSEPEQQNMVQKFEAGLKAAEDANADLTVDIVKNIKIDRSGISRWM